MLSNVKRKSLCVDPSSEVYTITDNVLGTLDGKPNHAGHLAENDIDMSDRRHGKEWNKRNIAFLLDKIVYHTENIYCMAGNVKKSHSGRNSWHLLALTLDRLCLCAYVLLLVGSGLAMVMKYIIYGQKLEHWNE